MTDTELLPFVKSKHVNFITEQESHRSFEYWLSEHLRMNGLYWGVAALLTMNELDVLPQSEVVDYVFSCWDEKSGAFGSFPKHDGHMLSTLSALQVLTIYDPGLATILPQEKKERLVKFITGLQLPNGSFQGDKYGEVDTRFVYTGVYSLFLLGALTKEIGDSASDFILKCFNFDGGFGLVPGAESHAAQAFTCVGTLAITGNLHLISGKDRAKLVGWLVERQTDTGGFNGRPEKLPDVCYSWWVLSSLGMLGKKDAVDLGSLEKFILNCQDFDNGGFSDRPDNQTDVYHTCFAITALSLIDHERYSFREIDPIFCLPKGLCNL
ncbi:Geranylgeranyl transferase type-2 subunit beta [Candida viswanathii]|uniref:Geranylgeranyl transferase type-2 subunit beta n=1 Tax=Candida viswanathii TaxID=5486 RepID=A0A367YJ93_9ASCO|nr:Geranylgeranyl transferase type-2 subunit beta [Candida viswanathii]